MEKKTILAGISQGDINGIGYEVIIKALSDPTINDICTPIVYGSPKVAAYHRKALNINNFNFNNIRVAEEAHAKKANMINCLDDNVRVELGKSTPQGGEAALISLEKAVEDLKSGKIDVLITAPIDKQNVQSENFHFNGHTDYLKSVAGVDEALMFMIGESMRIGVATDHVPLNKVSGLITIETLLRKIRLMNQSLILDFSIRKPRIAVLGLNPHAGDNSLLGTEEAEIISPAIQQVQKEGIMAFGPFPADGFSEQVPLRNLMEYLLCIMIRDLLHLKHYHSIPELTLLPDYPLYAPHLFMVLHSPWQGKVKHQKIPSVRQYTLPAISSEKERCIKRYQKIPLNIRILK